MRYFCHRWCDCGMSRWLKNARGVGVGGNSEDGRTTGIWTNSHSAHHTDIPPTRDTPRTMRHALANLVVCTTWHSMLVLGSERESDAMR